MIHNSRIVIEDCKLILEGIDTVEEYIKSDAKVAVNLHTRLIDRLTKILNGEAAFENEDHLKANLNKLTYEEIYKRCAR